MKTHFYTEDIINICDKKHLTVDEIFEEISKNFSEVGKSSIYRNVEQLVKKGELRKVTGIGKKAYFEKNNGNHIHLIDEKTGKIFDLDKNIEIKNLPKNFKTNNIDIKIFGEFI